MLVSSGIQHFFFIRSILVKKVVRYTGTSEMSEWYILGVTKKCAWRNKIGNIFWFLIEFSIINMMDILLIHTSTL
jgi:hypothetical protein